MKKCLFIISTFFLIGACVKEKEDFAPETEINIVVKNDKGEELNGANINLFETEKEFLDVINTPAISYNTGIITKQNGNAFFKLKSERPYLILITYYDSVRKMTLSNLGISSYINPLPTRTTVYLQMKVWPYDGHVIFFTKEAKKLPIEVLLSDKDGRNNKEILTNIYSGTTSVPGVASEGILSFQRQPGTYTYYAKSADGCAWTGVLDIRLGEVKPIEISHCESAYLTFYTTNVKDESFPLTVIFNDVDTAGQINTRKPLYVCGDDISNTLTVLRNKGLYNYIVRSKDGLCVWTGAITAKENECQVIKIEDCEQ